MTELQASILITLQRVEFITVKDISGILKVHRQQIYPELSELQKDGLIVERLGRPYKYKAIPVGQIIKSILKRKTEWISEMETKTSGLLERIRKIEQINSKEEYSFDLISGAEPVRSALYEWKRNARNMDIIMKFDPITYKRSEKLQTPTEQKELQFRVITDSPKEKVFKNFKKSKNAQVKYVKYDLPVQLVIYDNNRAHIDVYVNRTNLLNIEYTVLTSNHPRFVEMLRSYFEVIWNSAESP